MKLRSIARGLTTLVSIVAFGSSALGSGLDADVAQEMKRREAIMQEVSADNFITREIEAQFAAQEGSSLDLVIERVLSDCRIPFSVEYNTKNLPPNMRLVWDLNDKVDSDGDGQFRNDVDAEGSNARIIYSTNRTPYTITVKAIDDQRREFVWEDKVSFNVQNGDDVLLDARGFVPDARSVEWQSLNGDPRDRNFRIVSPNRLTTSMRPTYPGVTEVTARITDGSGNNQKFTTKLYVFNRNPELFQMRGIRFGFPPAPQADMDYIALAFELAKEYGFNFLCFSPTLTFTTEDGSYVIQNLGTSVRFENDYENLRGLVEMAHERGLKVALNLVLERDKKVTFEVWQIQPNNSFFYSPNGFFSIVSRYIDICNEKKVDLFTPMSELGGMDSYEARPYIDELISFLEENLIYTQFTFQNFLFSAVCKPYYGNCGTDYNKLSLIGWSAFESIAWTDNSSIYEMKSKFRNQHLVTVDRVHRRFPNLEQLIYEIGFPSVNKGSMIFFRAVQEGEHVDYEEQRRAVAAVMRGLYDYIKNGNDFLKGIFWCNWVIYSEANNAYWLRNNFQLFRKPAMEEIYTFFSSKPEELFDLPLYFAFADWFNAFVDFRQEVAVTHVSHPLIVQDFERIGGYGDPTLFLAHYGIVHTKALVDLNLLTSRRVAYNGNQSLEILYDNFTGRGGEAVIIPKLELDTWQDVDTISLSIKREDPNIGFALILFDTANPQQTYTQRLPLHKVGEWEQIGVYIDNFDRVVGSGDTTIRSIGREHLNPNYIGILLYSLDGSPVDSEVYIDDIGVTLKSQE